MESTTSQDYNKWESDFYPIMPEELSEYDWNRTSMRSNSLDTALLVAEKYRLKWWEFSRKPTELSREG